MISTLVASMLVLASPSDASSDAHQRATELVRQLGNEQYKVRQAAAKELVRMGSDARKALEFGLSSPDVEVKELCAKLLPRAIEFHLNELIEKFLKDPKGPLPQELPGLKAWVNAVGSAQDSLDLYRETVLKHHGIMITWATGTTPPPQIYQQFVQEVYDRERGKQGNPGGIIITNGASIEPTELALFLLMGSDERVRKAATATNYIQGYSFLNAQIMTQSLTGTNGRSVVIKKLFAMWLEKEEQVTLLRRGISLAAQHRVKEAFPALLNALQKKETIPTMKATMLASIAKMGTKDNLKDLEPFLKDKSLVYKGTPMIGSVEMRDVALGVALELTGQQMKDYGFNRTPPATSSGTILYIYFTIKTEEEREAAHKKWQDWVEAQKKK